MLSDPALFACVRLFEQVRFEDVAHYLDECGVRDVAAGATLLSPAHPARGLLLLVDGEVEVRRDGAERRVVARLGRGDTVGELSAIDTQSPIAYVVATGACRVVDISHDTLWALVGASHGVARNLLRLISGRIREDNRAIADSAVVARHFRRRSVTDALTGLHNRRWMDDAFRREIGRAVRAGTPAALLLLDVDHFSDINTRHGHLVGDHVLGQIAERLKSVVRPDDLLARYGGDEFAALLPATGAERAEALAERLCSAVSADAVGGAALAADMTVSVSVGIGLLDAGDTLPSLLQKADEALYRAKRSGRNRASD